MRSLRAVADLFPQANAVGLTDEQVSDSRSRFGPNRLTPLPREPAWQKFLAKFDDPIIKILLAASLLKIVVDLFEASPLAGAVALGAVLAAGAGAAVVRLGAWLPALAFALAGLLVGASVAVGDPSYEGAAVMVAVLLATGVAFLSEYRSDREFEKLNATRDAIRVKVERNGAVHTVPLEDVVVGDLVALEMGDEVPADGRVVRANELRVDQALMTGESEPVKKAPAGPDDASDSPDQPGCVFRGTQVADGAARMVVTNVGDDTMLGQIARRLSGSGEDGPAAADSRVARKLTISKASTPLQEKLEVLARRISRVGYAAAVAIFVALLVRGLAVGEVRAPGPDEDAGKVLLDSVRALLSYFVYMVIVVVVAVPEGLPMSVTVSLAVAWRKMSQANSLVRQLVACETIGSATVICSDKTGTLTQNRMTVARVGLAGRVFEGSLEDGHLLMSSGVGDWPGPDTPLHWLVVNAAVNSTANLEEKGGKLVTVGNSTEGSLLHWLRAGAWFRTDGGLDHGNLGPQYPVRFQLHFSSERKRMTSVVEDAHGRLSVLVKGAPEAVLARCDTYLARDGTAHELTPAVRAELQAQISSRPATRCGRWRSRTPSCRPTSRATRTPSRAAAEAGVGLAFDGWVGIRDPLRGDVREAGRAVPGGRHRGEDDHRRHARDGPRHRPRDRAARRAGRDRHDARRVRQAVRRGAVRAAPAAAGAGPRRCPATSTAW
jgi:Ca2+-transporting ATPase